jgi:hypothetical protein
MFSAERSGTLRRMKLEEILTKLEQIEEQAALTLTEYPRGLTVERQRLIVGLTKQLRSHVEDQLRHGPRQVLAPAAGEDTEANHLRSIGTSK